MGIIDKLFIGIILTIFVGVVVHAPLTVWLGTIWPDASLLVKSWKEILMGAAAVLALFLLWRRKQWVILKNPLIILAAAYAVVHVALIPFMYQNPTMVLSGLLIDLRYILFFVLVMIMASLYPQLRRLFVIFFLAGAVLVCGFAALQVFVLPPDILSALGYGDATIVPYMTVDENPDYIRVNSTLRGPNPLGAYGVIAIAVAVTYMIRKWRSVQLKSIMFMSLLSLTGLVAVWASYSRSALVAAIITLAVIFLFTVGRRLNRWVWISLVVVGCATLGGLYAARDTSFVSNVILHENEGTGGPMSSNDGHFESLGEGTNRLMNQPLGAGIGSTGSASLHSTDPIIIENQYLFIAHEAGWIGLALFAVLFILILEQLWRQRSDWLALAVFASGVGLALIGVLLPVWVDDTVSIIWWGLAGFIIGGSYVRTLDKTPKRTA